MYLTRASAVLALATAAALALPATVRALSTGPPACGPVAITGPDAAQWQGRICAVLARAPHERALIDAVYVAPASGAGMVQPQNADAPGDPTNCGEAPRGVRQITVRDHPACNLAAHLERYLGHELGHRRWEMLNPGEPYGPRWQAEEGYADGYADGLGYRWWGRWEE